mgnify:CR=1 FL=1
MQKFKVIDWGLTDYQEAWDKQKELVSLVQKKQEQSTLVLCEHPTVITIGKNGNEENLTRDESFYKENSIKVIYNNRGGDVTLHNPKQLVAYPIFNLSDFKQDLHWFLRTLEDVVIRTIQNYGIDGGRVEEYTGVWIDSQRKICAMGLHCSRWVTSHGLALNVNNNIDEFDYIIPCGIKEKEVTSIEKEIGTTIDFNETKQMLKNAFQEVF